MGGVQFGLQVHGFPTALLYFPHQAFDGGGADFGLARQAGHGGFFDAVALFQDLIPFGVVVGEAVFQVLDTDMALKGGQATGLDELLHVLAAKPQQFCGGGRGYDLVGTGRHKKLLVQG